MVDQWPASPQYRTTTGPSPSARTCSRLSPTCNISPGGFTWNNSGTRESGLLTRFREGEGQRLADSATRDQHADSVDAHPETTRRRHRAYGEIGSGSVQARVGPCA